MVLFLVLFWALSFFFACYLCAIYVLFVCYCNLQKSLQFSPVWNNPPPPSRKLSTLNVLAQYTPTNAFLTTPRRGINGWRPVLVEWEGPLSLRMQWLRYSLCVVSNRLQFPTCSSSGWKWVGYEDIFKRKAQCIHRWDCMVFLGWIWSRNLWICGV